ncbi:MAG: efflux RND transporter periplasmic adaptor subunit [Beijerinckiaceae bacterium]
MGPRVIAAALLFSAAQAMLLSHALAGEPVRGIVRAVHEAWIATELNARMIQISRREGESFKKGDVLIAFDCDKYNSELEAARAEQEFNKLALDNSIELDKRRAIGKFEVAQNKTKFDKAKAQAETLATRVRECTIAAPFDGRIAEMKARAFETSTPNQPLMRLINTDALEIELIVPSLWLRWIQPGFQFRVKIDETETEHTASVQRMAATVDSVSQTVKIMAVFAQDSRVILPGMSLTAELNQPAP